MTLAPGDHPHPLLLQGDGSVERVGQTALIVGWQAAAAFTEVCTQLAAGNTLVLFTDGLLETVAGHGGPAAPLSAGSCEPWWAARQAR